MLRILSMFKNWSVSALSTRTRSLRQLVAGEWNPDRLSDLKCVACGAPAAGWTFRTFARQGAQVVEGAPVCLPHRAEAARKAG